MADFTVEKSVPREEQQEFFRATVKEHEAQGAKFHRYEHHEDDEELVKIESWRVGRECQIAPEVEWDTKPKKASKAKKDD